MNLGNLQQLQLINLQVNQLRGELGFLTSLSNCNHLKRIQIGKNAFSVNFPKSIAFSNWSDSLETFIIAGNGITGEIPLEISKLSNLMWNWKFEESKHLRFIKKSILWRNSKHNGTTTEFEYGSEGLVSTMGDVYSDGILLMETFTRKKPMDDLFVEELTLKRWVFESFPDRVVDANLFSREDEQFSSKEICFKLLMELALQSNHYERCAYKTQQDSNQLFAKCNLQAKMEGKSSW
ncbi:hypothetical protein K7X08_012740 [Anisodus acutangulus]|uniref:Uncharacterized protein n=1 Tax=Anisodus acutangulus TaxID=402998 RepID=A0A9Q1RDU7_9SOLA|nr:hypothetical protein K7X08_012740 [Anisodus acutangulus]